MTHVMPKIILKPKSPEFADPNEHIAVQPCEMPGCSHTGGHKAPKHRALNEYYDFCVDHVREYNKAWDFFFGMSQHEVQNHIEKSHYGDRPTWKYGINGVTEESLLHAAQNTYNQDEPPENREERRHIDTSTPEYEAMAIMGLEPPVTLDEIKTRYKTLAKKHHPDLNKDDPQAEELLKKINMAYTILKLAFQNYKNLPE